MDDDDFGRAICVCLDVEGYSRRSDPGRKEVQDRLVQLVEAAAARARLNRADWSVQEGGDDMVIVAPLDASEPRYIDDFIDHLGAGLLRFNGDRMPASRMRLRVAVNVGVAYPGANGWVGDGVIDASRLIDSDAVREVLRQSQSDLVLVLSDSVFRDVVRQGHTRRATTEFTLISIEEPKVAVEAWVWTGQPAPPPATSRASDPRHPSQSATTINNIDEVHAETAIFGTVIPRGRDDDR